jgi:hypothetical protein
MAVEAAEIRRLAERSFSPDIATEDFRWVASPDGRICVGQITIGGKTAKELEKTLVAGGFEISGEARDMLRSKDFTTLPEQQTLSLVRIRVSDLVWASTGSSKTDQIHAKANELGLDLCPAEVGPYLRLAYKDQPLDEYLFVGMKQIGDSHGSPHVLELDRDVDGSWLNGLYAHPASRWSQENEWVFSLRK